LEQKIRVLKVYYWGSSGRHW